MGEINFGSQIEIPGLDLSQDIGAHFSPHHKSYKKDHWEEEDRVEFDIILESSLASILKTKRSSFKNLLPTISVTKVPKNQKMSLRLSLSLSLSPSHSYPFGGKLIQQPIGCQWMGTAWWLLLGTSPIRKNHSLVEASAVSSELFS